MGIKSEFYLSVSLDLLREVISHVIPEGEIVDDKVKLGSVNANVKATRTGTFTTYVKDQAIYLAAHFHANLKFPNFFANLLVGKQKLEFTVTVKCSVITTENLKITLNLNVFDIDWKAKPTLPGGITVAGHVEPFFRNWLNGELQKVAASINANLSFQAEVESLLQKIQAPIKLQSFLIKSGSQGTAYYIHPNPEITMTPIQITDAGITFQATVDVKTTIDLNPLVPNNKVIADPLKSEETGNCYGSTKQNTGRKLMELRDMSIDVEPSKLTQQNLAAENDIEEAQTSSSAGQLQPWITGVYRQGIDWFSSWWNSVPKMTEQSTDMSEEEIISKREVVEKAFAKAESEVEKILLILEFSDRPNKEKLKEECLHYKKEIDRYHRERFTVSTVDLEKLDRVLNKLLKKVCPTPNLFVSDRLESMYTARFFNSMPNASTTSAIASVDIPRLG